MSYSKTSVFFAPVLILALFSPSLLGVDCLAFRDVGHFYTPLYDYVAERCHQQWIPLWNPLDQTGLPLIGETTTAVFYPLRYFVFYLPLSTETAMVWYIVLHLIIASFAARSLARWAACEKFGMTVASILYPLSGSVLFLYTNPPFLVGASWLPIALGAMLIPGSGSRRYRITVAGMAMAMMMLGGDPQAALHVMIVVSLVALIRFARQKSSRGDWVVLLGTPLLAAMLSAPQLAASINWSQQSERLHASGDDSWTDPPVVGGKRYQAFQYSLPPWHVAELATPNAFGSFLPVNQRLSRLLSGDGRVWTPSIYMGVITFLGLWIRLRFRHQRFTGPWLTICLVSLLLCFGHFGVAWLVQAATGWLQNCDSAVGGPYWVLYHFLPGYDSFRYPAKWLPFFALAATVVTAQTCDRLVDQRQTVFASRVVKSVLRFAVLVLGLLVVVQLYRWLWTQQLSLVKSPADFWWGPLNVIAGLKQLTWSLCQTFLMLIAVAIVLRTLVRDGEHRFCWSGVVMLLVALDLGISGYGMLHQVSRAEIDESRLALDRPAMTEQSRWMRTRSGAGWPSVWRQDSSPDRLIEVESSSRAAWFGRWHLADRVHVLNNMISIRSRNAAVCWQAMNQVASTLSADDQACFWSSVREWLAIDGVVHASSGTQTVVVNGRKLDLVDLTSSYSPRESDLCGYSNWQVCSDLLTVERLIDRLQQRGFLVNEKGQASPEKQMPLVQSQSAIEPVVMRDQVEHPGTENEMQVDLVAKQIQRTPESVIYRIQVRRSALITRPTLQDGNWQARFASVDTVDLLPQSDRRTWKTTDVHCVDAITQGVILPAGEWYLEYYYRPWWLTVTLALLSVGWSGTLACFIRWRTDPAASGPDVPVPATDASC